MMHHTSRNTALAATGIGTSLLLAACGSSGGSSPVADPPTTQSGAEQASTSEVQSPQTSRATSAPDSTTSSPKSSTVSRVTSPEPSTATRQSTAASAGGSAATDAPVPRCTVDQLKLSVGGGNSDMQGSHRPLRFTNISDRVCRLIGAPGVSYVAGDDGHQVGREAQRIVGHQPVVLIPNATASAGLFISSAPRKSDCQRVTVRGLRVFPPDSYRSAYVPLPEVTCKPPQHRTYLKVGPILPGPTNTGV